MKDPIQHWKAHRTQKAASHKKLVNKLRSLPVKKLSDQAASLHTEAFQKINCLDCANCCTSIPPMLNNTDIDRISKFLGMDRAFFEADYVTVDDDNDLVINSISGSCPA